MRREPSSGADGSDLIEQMLVGLLATGAGFVLFKLFITQSWADLAMVLLVLTVPVAAYAVRREARRQLSHGHSADNSNEPE